MSLVEFYRDLIIKQYWDKPNARAEIELKAQYVQALKDVTDEIRKAFELDTATGDRLDKIGEIVGISRVVPFGTPKVLFGFDGDASARGMADLFDPTVESAPFANVFEADRTDTTLNDNEYREFIKLKIAKNNARAVIVGDVDSVSIQDVITQALDGKATVFDGGDMSLTLELSPTIDFSQLDLVLNADLLPSPQGVGYAYLYVAQNGFFGFEGDATAQGFSDVNDPSLGGQFAELYTGGDGSGLLDNFREGYLIQETSGYLLTESGLPLQFESYQ